MYPVANIYADRLIESEFYFIEQGVPKAEKASGK